MWTDVPAFGARGSRASCGGKGVSVVMAWVDAVRRSARAAGTRFANVFQGRTLGRQVLMTVIPVVVFVTILSGISTYRLVRKPIVSSVRQLASGEAAHLAAALTAYFNERLEDMESLVQSPLFSEFQRARAGGDGREAAARRRVLERVLTGIVERTRYEGQRVYRDAAYYDAAGRPIHFVQKDGALANTALPAGFFNHLKRGRPLDFPVENTGPAGPVFKRLTKPAFDDNGDFLGVLVMDCDLSPVVDLLRNARVSADGTAYLVDADGRNFLELPTAAGRKNIRVEAPLKETQTRWNWRVIVDVPEKGFLVKTLWQSMAATVALSVLATLLITFLTAARVSDLMSPVKNLVEGTRRFAAGDMSFRFSRFPTIELNTLGASFNRMAETLEGRGKELEQRLRQLTALKDMEEAVIQRQEEDTVLRLCIEAVARGFSFDRVGLYWVDQSHKEIVGRFLYGSDPGGFSEVAFRKRRVPVGGSDILNEVLRSRTAVWLRSTDEDPRVNRLFVDEARTREFVMAPICGKDKALGVLTADNLHTGRPLSESDREGLMLYAHAVGLALENAGLFQTVAENESRLRTVLENSPEAIIGLSREHWIGTWNRGAEKIFGFTAPEVLGKPLTILFPKATAGEFKKLLARVMEKGSVRDFTMTAQSKDGRPLELSVSWGGQHADFWMNKEWTLVIRDITEARRMQQQLIRSEKLSAVGQLISGIAHELNNPLQAVVGYSDILGDDVRQKTGERAEGKITVDAKDVLNDLRIITENAMRCQKIIENLLLFVRQGEIEKKPVDLAKVVQSSRELLQYKLKKAANIQVDVDFPDPCPKARGNFQQIQQVFVNLMNNACDAMIAAGGDRPKAIRIAARETVAGVLRVEIADTGPGIPPEARDHVFEPFFTTKPEGRGTGLGLPVCRQIIEEHGGRLEFVTEVNRGTTFWFELPVAKDELAAALPAAPSLPPVRGRTILLVDDEPDVLGFLSKAIRAEGNTLEVAGSLRDAIARAGGRPYDLVISDVRLGEGTGLSLYENWSLWTAHPRPPFLFMTGDVINGASVIDIEKKGLPLLRKPIDLSTFQHAVRKILAGTLNNPPSKS